MDQLFAANNPKLDHEIYCTLIPAWAAKFKYEAETKFAEYEELPNNAKKVFRALVYEQYHRIENNTKNQPLEYEPLEPEEFILLYNFLDFINYNKKEFLPYMRRYLYKHRGNFEFMKQSAKIHNVREYLNGNNLGDKPISLKEYYSLILGLSPANLSEKIANLESELMGTDPIIPANLATQDTFLIDVYACLLMSTEYKINPHLSFQLFKLNWEENKNSNSLHNLAACYYYRGHGCTVDYNEAFKLFKLNWEENKHSNSLHNLAACYYYRGHGCTVDYNEAFKLYKLNWEENKNFNSLHNLAVCYHNGHGCTVDYNEAFKLYKLNWEENKNSNSLHNLAVCYHNGYGCTVDLNEYNRLMEIYNVFYKNTL